MYMNPCIPPLDRLGYLLAYMRHHSPDLNLQLPDVRGLMAKMQDRGFQPTATGPGATTPSFFATGGARAEDLIYEVYEVEQLKLPLYTQRATCVLCKEPLEAEAAGPPRFGEGRWRGLYVLDDAPKGLTLWTREYGPLVQKGHHYYRLCTGCRARHYYSYAVSHVSCLQVWQ